MKHGTQLSLAALFLFPNLNLLLAALPAVMDKEKTVEIAVNHLPPIILSFTFPKNYPSESQPEFKLSCHWLSPYKLIRLCKKLDELWVENKGSVIIYIWTDFLKLETLEFLKINSRLEINITSRKKYRQSNKINPSTSHSSRVRARRPLTRYQSFQIHRKDPRVISSPVNARDVERYLKAYNEDRCEAIFLRSCHDCGICFESKIGLESVKFKPCCHIYCRNCVGEFFKVRIRDGSVQEMPCPYDKCPSQASQRQIKEVVGGLMYNKYDSLLLTATLNAMDDVTYCPRITCNTPVMTDPGDKLAVCSMCKHVFCTFCRMTYHGVAPCRLRAEEEKELMEKYENGDQQTKEKLEKRFGKKHFLAFIADIKSKAWIDANSKPCPKCGARIEKFDGCNKMVCKSCNSFFCWLCLTILDNATPYDHFFDENSSCMKKLFEGADIPDEDWDPEEEGEDWFEDGLYYEVDDDDEDWPYVFYEMPPRGGQ